MSQETIGSFFGGGGGQWARFPIDKPGTTVEGTIARVHPPEPQTDFDTGAAIPGKLQVRIDLQTNTQDDDDDDGVRTLYVKGWMTGAISDAIRKAGAKEPEVGAHLAVTYTGTGPSKRPGLSGPKLFTAVYKPSGSFFGGDAQPQREARSDGQQHTNAPVPSEPPKGIDPQAWANMPEDARQAIANTIAGMPPF